MSKLGLLLGAAALACGSATAVAPAHPSQPQAASRPPPAAAVAAFSPCPPLVDTYEPRAPHDPEDGEVHLPLVPLLRQPPGDSGGASSVGGASLVLRTRSHQAARRVTLQGYIVRTNRAKVPAFWLGDTPDAAPHDSIKVMGRASSYAAGAHVRVTGTHSIVFAKPSAPLEADIRMGILTLETIELLEPAAELSTLPGVERRTPAK